MDIRTVEFDNFGPWIVPVTTPDEIPRLYRDYGVDLDRTRLVLKIPRNIERRNAHPGMDLYDQLVIVDGSTLTVLRREGDAYERATIEVTDIVAFEDSVDLLDGRLSIRSRQDDHVQIAYNGSSRSTMTNLMNELRVDHGPAREQGAADTRAAATTSITPDKIGGDSLAILAAYREHMAAEGAPLSAASHASRALKPAAGASGSLVDRLWQKVLYGAIFALTADELLVFSRRDWLARHSAPTTSEALRIIPLAGITGVTQHPHPRFANATSYELASGSTTTSLIVPTDSDAATMLSSVTAAAPGTSSPASPAGRH